MTVKRRKLIESEGRHLLAAWLVSSETSQSDLAGRLGVTASLVNQWLSGASRPGEIYREALEKIAGIQRTSWDTASEAARRAQALAAGTGDRAS